MQGLKKWLFNEYVIVFLFCIAVIQGPAFSLMDNYDQATCVDCQTYIGIARLDFNQSPVRRYRPIVPLVAGGINYLCGGVFRRLQPGSFEGDFGLLFSFFIVNNILTGFFGVLIYRYCRVCGVGVWPSVIGLLVMLTCRWTPYIAGTSMVDSLYCVVLGLTFLGIEDKNTKLTLLAIFIGPFAKEAFIFVAPVIFFFSHIPKWRLLIYFLLSGVLVFTFRYCYDRFAGFPPGNGIDADMSHIVFLKEHIQRLFGFHSIYDIFSNFGLWFLVPVLAIMAGEGYMGRLKQKMHLYMPVLVAVVFVHMLLSGSFARMFYLLMPLICLVVAVSAEEIKKQYFVF